MKIQNRKKGISIFRQGIVKTKYQQYRKEKKSNIRKQQNKTTIILACIRGYSRLTRFIGRLCYVPTLQNFTSRILTLSFAELQQAEMGQNAQLCKLPSYVEQTRLCYLYCFLLSNTATTCTYVHGPSLQIARVVLCL